jgi:glycosyltransferase involved in cell wall biosynthesis
MKIIILSPEMATLLNFRLDMMRQMVEKGHEVIAVAPEGERIEELEAEGIKYKQLKFSNTRLSILKDIRLFKQYLKLLKDEQPDSIFAYAAKPVIYGSLAAKTKGIKHYYAMVSGSGAVFVGNEEGKGIALRAVVKYLYKIALKYCTKVIFQNNEDLNDFVTMKLVQSQQCVRVNGSGVNMSKFQPKNIPTKPITFVFIGRLLKTKGLIEFLEAAKRIKRRNSEVRFQIVGNFHLTNPHSISKEQFYEYVDQGIVEYIGSVNDVRPYLKQATVMTLPSYYGEGVPKILLEALAMGRPVITTDHRGCRETVDNGVNGWCIPVKNIDALEEKMMWMVKNPSKLQAMGDKSLKLCKEKFDVKLVNEEIFRAMNI